MTEAGWRADPATAGYDEVRTRIVEAAERHVEKNGLTKVRIEEIADAADCSRATIYRYFADKDELVRELLVRRAQRIADTLADEFQFVDDPGDILVKGVLRGIDELRADPYFESFFGPLVASTTARIAGGSQAVNDVIIMALEPLLAYAEATGRLRPEITPSEAAEWAYLVTLALITIPSPVERTPAEREDFLRKFLVPPLFR